MDEETELFEIECRMLKLPEFSVLKNSDSEFKDGRYMASCYWDVKGFGYKRWVIGGYIDVNHEAYIEAGFCEEDIVAACIRHLNKPPLRKKYQRRLKNPLYGNLEEKPHQFKLREKDGKSVIEIALITDKRKNSRLWGEGQRLSQTSIPKLGRPRKKA